MSKSGNIKALILSFVVAIGIGTVGIATFAHAQTVANPQSASTAQKDTDTETNDDSSTSPDPQNDGETKD
ncbi:MAG: hypothetical protein JWN75_688 [Candidatus Saccharibacteria bacterium]|nr:hypothetical protein [Candidatus Saccharibacteria bacterium]